MCNHVRTRDYPAGIGADETWDIYTFNTDIKNRLRKFAARYPEPCQLKAEDKELGCQTYVIEKSRVSIQFNSPQSAERRKVASEYAKENGISNRYLTIRLQIKISLLKRKGSDTMISYQRWDWFSLTETV